MTTASHGLPVAASDGSVDDAWARQPAGIPGCVRCDCMVCARIRLPSRSPTTTVFAHFERWRPACRRPATRRSTRSNGTSTDWLLPSPIHVIRVNWKAPASRGTTSGSCPVSSSPFSSNRRLVLPIVGHGAQEQFVTLAANRRAGGRGWRGLPSGAGASPATAAQPRRRHPARSPGHRRPAHCHPP